MTNSVFPPIWPHCSAGAWISSQSDRLLHFSAEKWQRGGGISSYLPTRSLAHESNAGLLFSRHAGPQIKCIFLSYAVWNYWLQWFNAGYEKVGGGWGEGLLPIFLECLFSFSLLLPLLLSYPPSFSLSQRQNHCQSVSHICLVVTTKLSTPPSPQSLTSCPSFLFP